MKKQLLNTKRLGCMLSAFAMMVSVLPMYAGAQDYPNKPSAC